MYASYGAVYVAVALLGLRLVDGAPLSLRDWMGATIILSGMTVLMGGSPRP